MQLPVCCVHHGLGDTLAYVRLHCMPTRARYDDAIKTHGDAAAACAMSMKLPPSHRDALSFLCTYLKELADHAAQTQMGPPNLAVTSQHHRLSYVLSCSCKHLSIILFPDADVYSAFSRQICCASTQPRPIHQIQQSK